MKFRFATAALLAATLSACGGGGGDSAAPQGVRLNGIAARDQALVGATVSVRCGAGSGSAITSAGGAYELELESGTLPCALRATSSDGATQLHSVVAGSGETATANVTPLTELVTAQVSAQTPSTYYDNFGSSSAATLTSSAVSSASTAVTTIVAAAGVDLTGVTDLVGGTLTPATSGSSGDAYGAALVSLDTKLTDSGTALADLSQTVADSAASGASTEDATATAAASVSTALQPAAGNCTALKSGAYRVVDPTDPANTFNLIHFDTAAMTVTDSDGAVHTLNENAACDYTVASDDQPRLLVAPSGLIVMRIGTASVHEAIAVPDQTLPSSVLAGDWNIVGMHFTDNSPTVMLPTHGVVHMTDAGAFTGVTHCEGLGNCLDEAADLPTFLASADGGFTYDDAGYILRLAAFRATNGARLLVMLSSDGEFYLLRPQEALGLPEVGTTNNFWNFSANGNHAAGPLTEDSTLVTAVDAGANTVTVQFGSDSHTDVRQLDNPFDGLRLRDAASCKAADGSAFACSSVVQMPMGGLGLTAAASADATRTFLAFSVSRP